MRTCEFNTVAKKVLPKAGVTSCYSSLVLNQTSAFQINSRAEMPRIQQYPKLWL
jgi:hypothetical protein